MPFASLQLIWPVLSVTAPVPVPISVIVNMELPTTAFTVSVVLPSVAGVRLVSPA